jgi:hypothetical protein
LRVEGLSTVVFQLQNATKNMAFFEVLNNMPVKIFEDAVTRAEYIFRIIH